MHWDSWFNSRIQRIVTNASTSARKENTSDAPQGSVLDADTGYFKQ